MTVGLLPPSSKIQGTKFSAAAFATNLPFYGDPVKTIRSHLNVVIFIATYIPPSITLQNLESKYFSNIFLITLDDLGDNSLGFKQTQLPADIASAAGDNAVNKGQFQLPITKVTPKGSGTTYEDPLPIITLVYNFYIYNSI